MPLSRSSRRFYWAAMPILSRHVTCAMTRTVQCSREHWGSSYEGLCRAAFTTRDPIRISQYLSCPCSGHGQARTTMVIA